MIKLKVPLWFKGGIISLLIFLLNFLINPFFEQIRTTSIGFIIVEIINAPILILSIPLYIIYSYIGFFLDMIFQTGIGYESLSVFPLGIIFMKVFSIVYFFSLGVFTVKLYTLIKTLIKKK